MKVKHVNIPIFVPHMGCPNDCSFCNQRRITGQSHQMNAQKAKEIIEDHLSTVDRDNTKIEVAFFGGSFTGIPVEEQISLLSVAYSYLKNGKIDGIRLSTRPDYISEEILTLLKKYNVTAIELGAQSMVDEVLSFNDRGHTSSDVVKASKLINDFGFELGLQMMTGLYKDNADGAIYSANRIIELKPKCVRIYPTLIIKNTKLEQLYNSGEYVPMNLDETVSLCAKLLQLFENADIKVLRVGLLGTDNINTENDVVAGPFHQSIGELAESEKFFNKLVKHLENISEEIISVNVNPRYISTAIGYKRKNVLRLKQKFPGKKIEFKQNGYVAYGEYLI